MKYLDTKKNSLEEAVSKAMNGDNKQITDNLLKGCLDLLLQKGRLMAKNQSTAMIDKEIKKEMGKLGIKEKLDPADVDNIATLTMMGIRILLISILQKEEKQYLKQLQKIIKKKLILKNKILK